MLSPRCVLPILALFWCMEEMSAAALTRDTTRNTRELNWQDLEPLQHHQAAHLKGELSVGDAAEIGLDSDGGPTQIEPPLAPTQHTSTRHQNQFQYIRKKNEKRRKVIPLDSIGRFKM